MKPSLCIDARMLLSSGIGTYTRALLSEIERLDAFQLTALIQSAHIKDLSLISDAKAVALKAPIYSFSEQCSLPLKIPSCDLFWSPHYNIPMLPIQAKKRAVTIHDLCHLDQLQYFSSFKQKCAHFLLSQATKKSDLVLTDSVFSKKRILHHFLKAKKKIHTIACGVTTARIQPSCSLSALGIKKPFILYVGNIKPHKNIPRLIQAFLKLPDTSLDLVLAGTLFSPLKTLSPRIHILENLSNEEISFLYTKATLLVQPSLYEGFGLTPLEAMYHGCPVVSSSSSSLPEVCGKAARYIDPSNVDSLCLGMQDVLTNPKLRSKLIQEGKARIKLFCWKKSAQEISNLFLKEIFS